MNDKSHDTELCPCCGQCRPCPTRPGKWRYKTMPDPLDRNQWITVNIINASEKGFLEIIPEGERGPIWWPNAIWEKLV